MNNYENAFKTIANLNNLIIIKKRYLVKGVHGLVKEVIYNGKSYIAKLIKKEEDGKIDESNFILELKSPRIVRVNNIFTKSVEGETYHLILMEKAPFRSLGEFNYYLHNKNLLNLIYKWPFEIVDDNLLRFFAKQIVESLELLNKSNYSHLISNQRIF